MQLIPITNTFNQSFKTSLNGQAVKFTIWYQDIGEGWFCTLEFQDGRGIISGARLNSGAPMLFNTVSDFLGEVVPVSTIATYYELGRQPWGNTHILAYLSPEEVEEA